jgi:O-methyltransferase
MIKRVIREQINNNKIIFRLYSHLRFFNEFIRMSNLSPEKISLFLKVQPFTMVSLHRLLNVYNLSEKVEKDRLKGAFVECGTWKGGCMAVMAYNAKRAKSNRKIWLFDSFEGLPEPTIKDGRSAWKFAHRRNSGSLKSIKKNVASVKDVNRIFSKLGINRKNVIIRKGWFQDTLPLAKKEIDQISILRLDGDWYESTKTCLENLYDKVSPNGFIIIDDFWTWEGCKKAVYEFIAERRLRIRFHKIDSCAVYFQKPRKQ